MSLNRPEGAQSQHPQLDIQKKGELYRTKSFCSEKHTVTSGDCIVLQGKDNRLTNLNSFCLKGGAPVVRKARRKGFPYEIFSAGINPKRTVVSPLPSELDPKSIPNPRGRRKNSGSVMGEGKVRIQDSEDQDTDFNVLPNAGQIAENNNDMEPERLARLSCRKGSELARSKTIFSEMQKLKQDCTKILIGERQQRDITASGFLPAIRPVEQAFDRAIDKPLDRLIRRITSQGALLSNPATIQSNLAEDSSIEADSEFLSQRQVQKEGCNSNSNFNPIPSHNHNHKHSWADTSKARSSQLEQSLQSTTQLVPITQGPVHSFISKCSSVCDMTGHENQLTNLELASLQHLAIPPPRVTVNLKNKFYFNQVQGTKATRVLGSLRSARGERLPPFLKKMPQNSLNPNCGTYTRPGSKELPVNMVPRTVQTTAEHCSRVPAASAPRYKDLATKAAHEQAVLAGAPEPRETFLARVQGQPQLQLKTLYRAPIFNVKAKKRTIFSLQHQVPLQLPDEDNPDTALNITFGDGQFAQMLSDPRPSN